MEHDGALMAVGEAVLPVPLATIVLAAWVARFVNGREPAGSVTVLEADSVVKEPVEPLMGVLVKAEALTGPVKVAPARGAYRANCVFNSAAVSNWPGVNWALATADHSKPRARRAFFIAEWKSLSRNLCPIDSHSPAAGEDSWPKVCAVGRSSDHWCQGWGNHRYPVSPNHDTAQWKDRTQCSHN